MAPTIHLQPTAALAERVLLPGDPGRALRLAQSLLTEPKMFNHHRGLWGYTGFATDGELLTIQSTGMGGPSAAIVLAELADLGARRAIRVGTCGALADAVELGALIVATEALAHDGTSRALGAGDRVAADPALSERLTGEHRGLVASSDLFYDPRAPEAGWADAGALAVEMECAAVFALAAARGIAAGAVLAVTDLVMPARRRIDAESLAVTELRMGEVARAALAPG